MPALLELSGVGAIVAGTLLAEVGDPQRFPTADHFASYCGAAPVERGSGQNSRMQVNPGGNRRLNWAVPLLHWSDYVWTVAAPGNSWQNKPTTERQNGTGLYRPDAEGLLAHLANVGALLNEVFTWVHLVRGSRMRLGTNRSRELIVSGPCRLPVRSRAGNVKPRSAITTVFATRH